MRGGSKTAFLVACFKEELGVTLDLYHQYKMLLQRANRNDPCIVGHRLADMAKAIAKLKMTRAEMISLAKEMIALEKSIPYGKVLISLRILNALKTGAYVSNVPYQKRHSWNEKENSTGYVYVATAKSKPGLSKLGATEGNVEERLKKYEYRYQYGIACYWKLHTKKPFTLEKRVAKTILGRRVSGLTFEDSNEWYDMSPGELKAAIIEVAME